MLTSIKTPHTKPQLTHKRKSDSEFTYGHSDTYITVKVNIDKELHNTIQNVLIDSVKYKNTLGIIKS